MTSIRSTWAAPRLGTLGVALAFASACSLINSYEEVPPAGTGGAGPGAGGSGGSTTTGTGGDGGDGGQPPIEVTTLAEGQSSPYGIVADDTHVYWTNFGDGTTPTGSVMRVPIEGGEVETLADGLIAPTEIVVGDVNVYWITFGSTTPTGGVYALPKTQGGAGGGGGGMGGAGGSPPVAPVELVGGYNQVNDLVLLPATNPPRIYYTCDQCDGGAQGEGRVEWLPADNSAGPTIVATGQGEPFSITAAGSNVFWVNRVGREVVRADTGGTVNMLTNEAGAADGVTESDGALFWTASEENVIYRMPVTGGTPSEFYTGEVSGFGIAGDGINIYWVAGGTLNKKTPAMAEPIAHITGQAIPFQLDVDATNLYWTDFSAGTVNKAPK